MKLFLRSLKTISLVAVVLAVPAFAVFGLLANESVHSSLVVAAEHDPLRDVSKVVEAPFWGNQNSHRVAVDGSNQLDSDRFYFTSNVPPPTSPPRSVR